MCETITVRTMPDGPGLFLLARVEPRSLCRTKGTLDNEALGRHTVQFADGTCKHEIEIFVHDASLPSLSS
jgi:hypothetical protein